MTQKYFHTAESDALIRQAYQSGDLFRVKAVRVTAMRIGWPGWAVKKRATALGLSRTKERPWSKPELDVLEKWAHLHPTRIRLKLKAAGFRRTDTGIVLKRKRLNLLANLDGYSATKLAGLFGIDAHCITRWIKFGWLPANRRGTERTALQGGDVFFIRHENVYRFVLEHPDEIDLAKVEKIWFLDLVTKGKIGCQERDAA